MGTTVSAFTVFLQGMLSFLSPCVLPLIPIYMGYLSGGAKTVDENGEIHYKQSKVIINTLCFILGISFTFIVLGLGFSAIGQFFSQYSRIFAIIGGILVILFGVLQIMGGFNIGFFSKERRLPFKLNKLSMNPFIALLFGFTFSFAWTPCIGPALAGVLLMTATAGSTAYGFFLIGVYTLGFVLPFLALGFFTGYLLKLFAKYKNVVKYTVRIGGAVMIIMGVLMITGWSNGISSFLGNSVSGGGNTESKQSTVSQNSSYGLQSSNQETSSDSSVSEAASSSQSSSEHKNSAAASSQTASKPASQVQKWGNAPDFTLKDQNGKSVTLSQYKGKTIYLVFWATWCGYCNMEIPDIQNIYEYYGKNTKDVIVLGVCDDYGSESMQQTLADNGGYYPSVIDTSGTSQKYNIGGYPTSVVIDKNGNVSKKLQGYYGASGESVMKNAIESAR